MLSTSAFHGQAAVALYPLRETPLHYAAGEANVRDAAGPDHAPRHARAPCLASDACACGDRAPKGTKGTVVVEEAVDPNERVTPPAFSEESLAALGSFATDTPYTDPDPQILPSSLEAVVASWQRPSKYLQALVDVGGAPCVVQPPLPNDDGTAASRELPNLLESVPPSASEGGAALAEARRALQWMISCMQLVALHAERMEAGCFLWELIHPQTAGRPRVVPSGKYAVKLFDQGAWRLVTVDDRMPFDASGAAILPRSVSRSHSRRLQPPPPPPPATCTPLSPTPRGDAAHPPLLPPHPPPAHPNRLTVPHPWVASEPVATYLRSAATRRRRHWSCGHCCSPRPCISLRPAHRRAYRRSVST